MGKMILSIVAVTGTALTMAAGAAAQSQARSPQQRDLQYQIATMESVLARAVEHGALEIRDRMQAIVPSQMLLSDNARVRGFPLSGYGIVFDVAVPGLNGTLPWSFRTMDQNNLGLESALSALRGAIEKMNDANLDQALKRIELQVSPVSAALEQPVVSRAAGGVADSLFEPNRAAASSLASEPAARGAETAVMPARTPVDPIMRNPDEAYRETITVHIKDAMLNHSLGLNLSPSEVLTVVAKSNEDMLLGASAPDSRVTTITVTSEDLGAFRSGQITRDEAHKRMTVRVF